MRQPADVAHKEAVAMRLVDYTKRFTLAHAEILLLALTLLATVVISALTLHQTTRHFEIERTSSFVARFNGEELVKLREFVDRWLESGETPHQLYDRSNGVTADATSPNATLGKADALETVSRLRTMANYFQEFGTALKIGSLNEYYAHELLGNVCVRYADALEPFIVETRERRKRPQAYEEVMLLKTKMQALDARE
jgi:hypothetical protein